MKCKKCGAELNPDFKFCRKCGTPVDAGDQADTVSNAKEPEHLPASAEPKPPAQTKEPEIQASGESFNETSDSNFESVKETGKKANFSKWILIGLAVLLLAAGIGGGSMLINANKTSDYQETISMANRYYNRQDYEMAEEYYLQAIEILPRQKEPYTQLVHIYIETEQPEKAEAILTRAKENLNVNEAEEIQQEIEQAVQEQEAKETAQGSQTMESEEEDLSSLWPEAAITYKDLLTTLLEGNFPKGYLPDWDLRDGKLISTINHPDRVLQYCLKDVDENGYVDLLLRYDDGTIAGKEGFIFSYLPLNDAPNMDFHAEFDFYPMTNGCIKEPISPFMVDWLPASPDFVPITIHKVNPETGLYEFLMFIEVYDKKYLEENTVFRDSLDPLEFPEEYDLDNNGVLYRVEPQHSNGAELFLDEKEFEELFNELTGGARELNLEYKDVTPELISQLDQITY